MKRFFPALFGLQCCFCALAGQGPAGVANVPPQVAIIWPNEGSECDNTFGGGTLVRLKAEAYDPDGSIAEVRFYMLTDLIGVVTNPPYTTLWMARSALEERTRLRAVAIDNLGARAESKSVLVNVYNGAPPLSLVKIISPLSGTLLPRTAAFEFTAEMLAAYSTLAPIEFFVGSNLVGIVNQTGELTAGSPPPASVSVTNLAEGDHDLYLRYAGSQGDFCACCLFATNRVRVTRLGIQILVQVPDEPFRFEVVTSFTNQPNIIERSPDLHQWSAISTNTPSTNRFTFADLSQPKAAQAFYRVFVPSD